MNTKSLIYCILVGLLITFAIAALKSGSSVCAGASIGSAFLLIGFYALHHLQISEGSVSIIGQTASFKRFEVSTPAIPEASDTKTKQNSEASSTGSQNRVSAEAILVLGEHLWYLCNPPWAAIKNVTDTMESFIKQVGFCELPRTLEVAKSLHNLRLPYDKYGRINVQGQDILVAAMEPIRKVVMQELKGKNIS